MLKKDTTIYDVHTLYKMYVYHSNNEDTIIIGNISSVENNIFHINELFNSQKKDYFSNKVTLLRLQDVKSIEILSVKEVNEFYNNLKEADLYYDNELCIIKHVNNLEFEIGDYIQDKEEQLMCYKITCVRFPIDKNEPIMVHFTSLRDTDVAFATLTSMNGIECCYDKITHLPQNFYRPFQKVLYVSEETNNVMSCGFYNYNNMVIGNNKTVKFCVPYNFETKNLIGVNLDDISISDFYLNK